MATTAATAFALTFGCGCFDGDALAFERTAADGSAVTCVLNLSETALRLPSAWGVDVLLASGDDVAVLATDDGAEELVLGSETALWLTSTP